MMQEQNAVQAQSFQLSDRLLIKDIRVFDGKTGNGDTMPFLGASSDQFFQGPPRPGSFQS